MSFVKYRICFKINLEFRNSNVKIDLPWSFSWQDISDSSNEEGQKWSKRKLHVRRGKYDCTSDQILLKGIIRGFLVQNLFRIVAWNLHNIVGLYIYDVGHVIFIYQNFHVLFKILILHSNVIYSHLGRWVWEEKSINDDGDKAAQCRQKGIWWMKDHTLSIDLTSTHLKCIQSLISDAYYDLVKRGVK